MPTPFEAHEVVGPTVVDGGLVRLMTDGEANWAERWNGERWISGPPEVREAIAPCVVDGALVRLVTDGRTDWVEQWNGERWIAGGATVRGVLMGPPASPETLRMFGYPTA